MVVGGWWRVNWVVGLRGDGVKLACGSGFEKWSDLGRAELSVALWCGAVLTRWLLFWVSAVHVTWHVVSNTRQDTERQASPELLSMFLAWLALFYVHPDFIT